MSRYLLSLITAFLLVGDAWAQPFSNVPQQEKPATTDQHHCNDAVTTTCLVDEIRSSLTPDIDPFKRERIMLALAQAQLADGQTEQALASYADITATTARAEFLVSYAKYLVADGDHQQALKQLREADRLLTEGQGDLDRLNATRQSQLIAKTFALAGSKAEGHAILEGIASYRKKIPLNPMLLALMLQVAKTEAGIGYRGEAARLVNDTYELVLDQEMEVAPEQVLQIFETWAALDAGAATNAAKQLAQIIGQSGPSTFEFALWTGLSAGLASAEAQSTSSDVTPASDDGDFLARAVSSYATAPERAAALLIVPNLIDTMKAAGKRDQARTLLDQAHAEASALASPMEKAPALLGLAKGFASIDATEQARAVLDELLAMPQETGMGGRMQQHFVTAVPAQLALLGKIDEAYDLAMKADGGSRDMALMMAADKLAMAGKNQEAMHFLQKIEGEIAVMMMAGMADRLAGSN